MQQQFGRVSLASLSDGRITTPFAAQFPDADVEQFRQLGGIDEHGVICFPLTTFVLRSGPRTIVVDTGLGPTLGPLARRGYSGASGTLPTELAAAGIDPGEVDTVILTHLHADHIGWNVVEAKPLFPSARYLVTSAEWEYWSGVGGQLIERLVRPLADAGRLDLVEDETEVAEGVRILATPGHTPGHASVLIWSHGMGAIITGDAAHHPGELESPDVTPTFDLDASLAAASRRMLADRAEADGLVIVGGHFPPPFSGTIVRVDGSRRWRWRGVDVM